MYGDAIGISFILDPVLLGQGIKIEHKTQAEDALFESAIQVDNGEDSPNQLEAKKQQLFIEYTNWIIKATTAKERNDFRFQMLKKRTKSCLQYWYVDGAEFPTIRTVALRVFSMVTSSAASERGFSTMSFVHSKLRNRLCCDTVKKLTYIKNNAPQLDSDGPGVDWEETDESGDDDGDAGRDQNEACSD
jgi:hypothetical protein